MNLTPWTEKFPWESEAQKKGFGAFLYWLRKLPIMATCENGVDSRLHCLVAFFAQKDHDAEVWRNEVYGSQVSALRDEIKKLQDRVRELERK